MYVGAGDTCTMITEVTDPDGDPLKYRWDLVPESTDIRSGGDAEKRPDAVDMKISEENGGKVVFQAPKKAGPYRLFIYVYDGNGNAADCEFPILRSKIINLTSAYLWYQS